MEKCFDEKFFTFESHRTISFCNFALPLYIETALKSLLLCLQIGYFTNFSANRLETFVVVILTRELKNARFHASKFDFQLGILRPEIRHFHRNSSRTHENLPKCALWCYSWCACLVLYRKASKIHLKLRQLKCSKWFRRFLLPDE